MNLNESSNSTQDLSPEPGNNYHCVHFVKTKKFHQMISLFAQQGQHINLRAKQFFISDSVKSKVIT